MYGLGMAKSLDVTLQELLLPGPHVHPPPVPRPPHQCARTGQALRLQCARGLGEEPREALKALVGLASVEDRLPQHPRFRGQESPGTRNAALAARAAPSTARSASSA